MMQNVEQVLVRGERLDVLVDRTDDLRDQVRAWLVPYEGLYVQSRQVDKYSHTGPAGHVA